jgi:hypothetical protein
MWISSFDYSVDYIMKIMLLTALVLLSGCEARIETNNVVTRNVPNSWNLIQYFTDDYGNCYASVEKPGSQSFAFTSIPCENMPR